MKHPVLLSLTLCLLFLGGCDSGLQVKRFKDAQKDWEAVNTGDYHYRFSRYCFCPGELTRPSTIVIRDNIVTDVLDPNTGETSLTWDSVSVLDRYPDSFITIDGQFVLIAEMRKQNPYSLSARFDDATGVPINIEIDYHKNAVDDEMALLTRDLVFD